MKLFFYIIFTFNLFLLADDNFDCVFKHQGKKATVNCLLEHKKDGDDFWVILSDETKKHQFGFLVYKKKNAQTVELSLLEVDKEHRENRFARTMLNTTFNYLKGIGITQVQAYSYKSALPFYDRVGAKIESSSPLLSLISFDLNRNYSEKLIKSTDL